MKMTHVNALLALTAAALLMPAGAAAQTLFRLPLSTASGHCTGTSCYVTAYYDLDRGTGQRDWSCGKHTYNNHAGTDIGIGGFGNMDRGRSVVAAAPGKVIAVHDGEFDRCTTGRCGAANYVRIQHADGKTSLYTHLRKWSVKVKVGQTVTCGQQLGLVGSSGNSTGAHLHFEVRHPTYGVDDPFRGANGCGGSVSFWVNQGSYKSLPSATCQTAPAPTNPTPAPTTTIIVDSNNARNDTAKGKMQVSSNWVSTSSSSGYYGTGYYYAMVASVSDGAEFLFYLPSAQTRTIDAWWTSGTNRSTSAPFVAFNASGTKLGTVNVNQRQNGGKWNTLGTFKFTKGWNKIVLSRWTSAGDVVIADAVRIR